MDTSTLILTRHDIRQVMEPADYLAAAHESLMAQASGAAHAPPPLYVKADLGGFHGKGALLRGERPVVAVKLNGNFPGNRERHGLPTIQGAILLCDAEIGRLLAIMDSIEVTLQRTAAASAMAARYLARGDAESLAIIGCGALGRAHLPFFMTLPHLKRATFWDESAARAQELARDAQTLRADVKVEAPALLDDAVSGAMVIATCTTSRKPFLNRSHAAKGCFVAATGADNPDKSEIAPELMRHAVVVTDVVEQCAGSGDLKHAIDARAMAQKHVRGNLCDIAAGRIKGRTSAKEIIVYDSTGTATQDVCVAAMIYARAAEKGMGMRVQLAGDAPANVAERA